MNIFFPLRPTLNVLFKNLPRDLTVAEVKRIVAFLEALVVKK